MHTYAILIFNTDKLKDIVDYSPVSELDFYDWNANPQSFGWAKSEAAIAARGGKFRTSKTFTAMEKVFRRNITEPILHNRVFKRIDNCCVAQEMC